MSIEERIKILADAIDLIVCKMTGDVSLKEIDEIFAMTDKATEGLEARE